MVKEIQSRAEFESEIRGPGLVVVDFFATWCGPCRKIAPFIEELSKKYPGVKFLKVDSDQNQDICSERRISALPTFHFIVNGDLKDEMKGADPAELEKKVLLLKVDVNPWAGQGKTLATGGPGGAGATVDPREARLRALGIDPSSQRPPQQTSSAAPAAATSASSAAMNVVDEDDEEMAIARAIAASLREQSGSSALPPSVPAVPSKPAATTAEGRQDALDHAEAEAQFDREHSGVAAGAGGDTTADGEELVPVPVDEGLLGQLLELGFPDVRARKGIVHGKDLEGAITWLAEHEEDPEIDQPYLVRKSDAIPKVPLTAEEKAARVLEMKNKIKRLRGDKDRAERQEEIKREKDRRERGQMLGETQEERERMMRKREAEKQKKEKDAAKSERERLRAEIARDKEVRKLNKGVLPSVLGVDGYNPSIIQYDVTDAASHGTSTGAAAAPNPSAPVQASSTTAAAPKPAAARPPASSAKSDTVPSSLSPVEKIDSSIQTLMRYRSGGDGGHALKLLLTYVKNIAENPSEAKYRSINTDSNAFKTKLSTLVGPLVILKSLGFEKVEDEGKLKLEGEPDVALFQSTAAKLTQAESTYRQLNP